MGGMGALRRPRLRAAGGTKYPSDAGIRRSCAAARGADIAARCPYHHAKLMSCICNKRFATPQEATEAAIRAGCTAYVGLRDTLFSSLTARQCCFHPPDENSRLSAQELI